MEYCGRDQQGSLISPANEADSGYEPSPSSTSGPCTMFSFENEEYSDPDDSVPSYEINSPDMSDEDDDVVPSASGRPSSSPIPIPLSGQSVLLSRSTPGFGYSATTSPLRRLSCPSQILAQQSLVRIVRHVATQTRTPTDSVPQDNSSESVAANEHRLSPMRGPLPDVVQHNGRRLGHVERARSASVSLPVGSHVTAAVFTEIGQTLRRMSDEFERTRRPSVPMQPRNSSRRCRSYSQSDT